MPSQFLLIAFGLVETCLGNAVTIWFLLPFLLEGLNSFYIFPYLPCLKAFPVFNVLETCRVYLLTIDLGFSSL